MTFSSQADVILCLSFSQLVQLHGSTPAISAASRTRRPPFLRNETSPFREGCWGRERIVAQEPDHVAALVDARRGPMLLPVGDRALVYAENSAILHRWFQDYRG